jgi:release factor glutamine methyltransferase
VEAARGNAAALAVSERIECRVGDYAREPDGRYDLVVSNPPYIRSAAIAGLERDVREYEPRAALDGGADGLDAYRAILSRAWILLNDTGFVAFEVGFDQSDAVTELCRVNMLNEVAVTCDLAGIRRVLLARPGSKCRETDQGPKILLGNATVSG